MDFLRNKFKRLKSYVRVIRYSYYTLVFNFYYLPFKQAIKFPFIFYNSAEFSSLKGTVKLTDKIRPGMVIFGLPNNPMFQKNLKFIWHNNGGECKFGQGVGFHQGCAIRIEQSGRLEFQRNISIVSNSKFVCAKSIFIGENTIISWDVLIMDTDSHPIYDLEKQSLKKIHDSIIINQNCWIGTRSIILKGTELPPHTILAANSLANKKYNIDPFSLIAGNPAKLKSNKLSRLENDMISDESIKKSIDAFNESKNRPN